MEKNRIPEDILNDRDFKAMAGEKNFITIVLTLIIMTCYFGFIYLVAFKKQFLAIKITGGLTSGILIGLGVILVSLVSMGYYVRWANSRYDDMVKKMKEKIEA
ncbi:MAG: DUF485 domain-containing protein [Dissulfurispiraceae bacterium]